MADTMAIAGYDNKAIIKSDLDIHYLPPSGTNSRSIDMETGKKTETGTAELDAYNPYQNRNVKHPTTYFETLTHLLKASLGTGILAMPSAFKNAGYLVGTLGTIAIGILCTYTIHMLVTVSHELCIRKKVGSLSYSGTVTAAFELSDKTARYAPFARLMTNVFLALYQLGSSIIYVVFIASNLKAVGDFYFGGNTDVRMYMVYILIPLMMISWIRNLKYLAPLSTIATGITVISLGIIFYYIFREMPSFVDREPVGTVQSIPLFFGTVLFAMEAIGMVLPLENEMENPKKFGSRFGVLNSSMVPISILYTVVGLLGYLKYGEKTTGSITLDIPQNELLAQGVRIGLSLAIYVTYALSNYVTYAIIWKGMKKKMEEMKMNNQKNCWDYGVRTSIVFVTFFLAIAIPNLEHLISLIGAFCLSSVGIALPAILSYMTFSRVYRKQGTVQYYIFCLRNFLIVVIAIFAFVVGVTTSVSDIIKHMT